MKPQAAEDLRCSFCSKPHADVKKLIAGPNDVAICDECVEACTDILADNLSRPMSRDEHERIEWGPDDLFSFMCPACGHRWKMAKP